MTREVLVDALNEFEQHPSGHWTLTGDAGEVVAALQVALTQPTPEPDTSPPLVAEDAADGTFSVETAGGYQLAGPFATREEAQAALVARLWQGRSLWKERCHKAEDERDRMRGTLWSERRKNTIAVNRLIDELAALKAQEVSK